MKNYNLKIIYIICFFGLHIANGQRPDYLEKDSIKSSLDGNTQVIYYDKSKSSILQPLVVELHSWSYSADSVKLVLTPQSHSKNWNYILPNFRGKNNHPKACCSEYVITDIDEAIDWALKNMLVDPKRIYVIGTSGGGYATLAMYMKSRHDIHSFSAWVPISDLAVWYDQSLVRKNKYAAEIVKCIGGADTFDLEKAKERSPLYWRTPIKTRENSTLQIYAGIHDGYSGDPVPISHSINFYNKLLIDYGENDLSRFVSQKDMEAMLKTQTFKSNKPPNKIGKRVIYYQKSSKNISLTIFEGGHEILNNVALDFIDKSN